MSREDRILSQKQAGLWLETAASPEGVMDSWDFMWLVMEANIVAGFEAYVCVKITSGQICSQG